MPGFYTALQQLSGKNIFLYFQPEILDWTKDTPVSLSILNELFKIDIPLPNDKEKFRSILGELNAYTGENIVIGWDMKCLFSYVLGRLGVPLNLNNIFDLKVLEWYCGIIRECPQSYAEAMSRLKAVMKNPAWNQLKIIYPRIYTPLITSVIPEVETLGINKIGTKKRLHSHYDIAGQVNGRMRCTNVMGFNPHSTAPEEKAKLRPIGWDGQFVYLDFAHMEVSVFQWLTGDPVLGQMLETNEDVYAQIWTYITTLPCNDVFRQKAKDIFLPVVYGQGVASVAERGSFPVTTAKKIVDKIYKGFPVGMEWMRRQIETFEGKTATDAFGRNREIDEPHKIRNFVVQSPASLLCLDKLVMLRKVLKNEAKIGFHIHDGYVLYVPALKVEKVRSLAIKTLEEEDDLFPGLKLKATCQINSW